MELKYRVYGISLIAGHTWPRMSSFTSRINLEERCKCRKVPKNYIHFITGQSSILHQPVHRESNVLRFAQLARTIKIIFYCEEFVELIGQVSGNKSACGPLFSSLFPHLFHLKPQRLKFRS